MGRSFSSIFGFGEPFFGFAKLPLEVPNASVERAKVALGREVQHAGDALHTLIERPLDAASETKPLDHQLLDLRISEQLRDPRVLHETEEAVFEPSHRSVVISWRLADHGLQLGGEQCVARHSDLALHEKLHRDPGFFRHRLPVLGSQLDRALGVARVPRRDARRIFHVHGPNAAVLAIDFEQKDGVDGLGLVEVFLDRVGDVLGE